MGSARAQKAGIPDKLYFKIGEVAKLVGVEPYVLRYWESEFPVVKPGKTRSHHRRYRRKDVEALLAIKRLLHDERFTIEGARKRLKAATKASGTPAKTAPGAGQHVPAQERRYRSVLSRVKKDLEALQKLLAER